MTLFLISDTLNQLFENSQSALIINLLENSVLFIFLSTATFLIVSTPVVLFYMSIDNYFKSKKNYAILEEEFYGKTHTHHPEYSKEIREKYTNHFSKYLSNLYGLIAWNLFSVIYILTGWEDILSGITGYFKFPFLVLQTYDFDNSINSVVSYNYNWLFMFIIFLITILGFQIGKYVAYSIVQKQLTKGEEVVSIA